MSTQPDAYEKIRARLALIDFTDQESKLEIENLHVIVDCVAPLTPAEHYELSARLHILSIKAALHVSTAARLKSEKE